MLKRESVKFNDWLNDDHNNLYTLVKRGELLPSMAKKFYIGFHVLSQQDKVTFQAYEKALKDAAKASTPSK